MLISFLDNFIWISVSNILQNTNRFKLNRIFLVCKKFVRWVWPMFYIFAYRNMSSCYKIVKSSETVLTLLGLLASWLYLWLIWLFFRFIRKHFLIWFYILFWRIIFFNIRQRFCSSALYFIFFNFIHSIQQDFVRTLNLLLFKILICIYF